MSCTNCTEACRHHTPRGCVLDLAAEGPMSAREVADTLGISRRRVHQILARAYAKIALQLIADDERSLARSAAQR